MEINELVKEAHGNAKSKGFYEQVETIFAKMKQSNLFSETEIDATKDAFIAQRLMLITSELGEALESNRKNKKANLESFSDAMRTPIMFKDSFEAHIKDSFEDELSDSLIRIADLAGWLGIDLEKHAILKHKYNSSRPHLHNKKY